MSRMKVLLLKDVPELGDAGDIYAVAQFGNVFQEQNLHTRHFVSPSGQAHHGDA